MEFSNIKEEIVYHKFKFDRERIKQFLEKQNLKFDKDISYTVNLKDENKIVATGSFSGKVLKCIAVDPEYKGMGLSNRIVTHLVQEQYHRGNTHLFLYTKPENKKMFTELGFHTISEIPSKVILMENVQNGIETYLKEISKYKIDKKIVSSIVVNCNPFTLGHQYLIEYAASRSDQVNVFVVWEDRSSFPADIRYKLVVDGVKHLSNVVVHKGKDYIISDATFPSYFIKDEQEIVKTHALLDLKVFTEHIAPALGISRRYVGEEPYCPVTKNYNEVMKKVLPEGGIEVFVIPRLTKGDTAVSASKVRECIRKGNLSEVKNLVPETTYAFLESEEAQEIINKIRMSHKRH